MNNRFYKLTTIDKESNSEISNRLNDLDLIETLRVFTEFDEWRSSFDIQLIRIEIEKLPEEEYLETE